MNDFWRKVIGFSVHTAAFFVGVGLIVAAGFLLAALISDSLWFLFLLIPYVLFFSIVATGMSWVSEQSVDWAYGYGRYRR